VGVGQSELEVAAVADTTVVVLTPNLGDSVQMIKAGILEIADVFIVNKADREGADRTVAELSMMLDVSSEKAWRPPIVKTSAPSASGVPAAVEALESHGAYLVRSGEGEARRSLRARSRLLALLDGHFRRAVEDCAPDPDGLEEAVQNVLDRQEDPYSAAARLFGRIVGAPRKRERAS